MKNVPPQNPDALSPDGGKAIAVIDGEEYLYDPVYLYRLSNACFDGDDKKSNTEIVCCDVISFARYGVFWGEPQGESAVCLELLYREGKAQYSAEDITTADVYRTELGEAYVYMNDDLFDKPYRDIVLARHKEAKFYPFQSDTSYLKELAPYLEKFGYIDAFARTLDIPENLANFLEIDQEQAVALLSDVALQSNQDQLMQLVVDKLMTKYNVTMVE